MNTLLKDEVWIEVYRQVYSKVRKNMGFEFTEQGNKMNESINYNHISMSLRRMENAVAIQVSRVSSKIKNKMT